MFCLLNYESIFCLISRLSAWHHLRNSRFDVNRFSSPVAHGINWTTWRLRMWIRLDGILQYKLKAKICFLCDQILFCAAIKVPSRSQVRIGWLTECYAHACFMATEFLTQHPCEMAPTKQQKDLNVSFDRAHFSQMLLRCPMTGRAVCEASGAYESLPSVFGSIPQPELKRFQTGKKAWWFNRLRGSVWVVIFLQMTIGNAMVQMVSL